MSLLRRSAEGDRRAFTRLVCRHEAALLRFARTVVEPAVVDDVVQETLLAAFRGAGSFEGRGRVRTWLFGIAFRQGTKARRRRAGEPAVHAELDVLGEAAGWGATDDDPETILARGEAERCLAEAFAALREDERAILMLRDVEQLTGAETAEVLDLAVPAMKSRLHRARLRLLAALRRTPCARELTGPQGGGDPDGP